MATAMQCMTRIGRPSAVPANMKPRIGDAFNLLKIGMMALVAMSIIKVSSLAPCKDCERVRHDRCTSSTVSFSTSWTAASSADCPLDCYGNDD